MSQSSILSSMRVIASKMLEDFRPACKADANFQIGIDNLRNILSIGEADASTTIKVEGVIQEMEYYKTLGVYIRGAFSPISPALAAQRKLLSGSFISGTSLLVMTKNQSEIMEEGGDPDFPKEAMWDDGAVIHLRAYLNRHPELIESLTPEQVKNMDLDEALLDFALNKE